MGFEVVCKGTTGCILADDVMLMRFGVSFEMIDGYNMRVIESRLDTSFLFKAKQNMLKGLV